MRIDPSEAWSRNQCGGVALDDGEFVAEDEFRSSNARHYNHPEKHT